ncbi:related to Autophagy-related protein 22-1 [Rhynchosporium agropyri]|uniref:Autophagy-related protein n=1 Tax=Rhynchosporium agropyri TaxID=914238 RepID=A0A1E1KGW0_9HELO|nr:related to Autophagy-related protein 22-1 [Rhynchosporium agropyri]
MAFGSGGIDGNYVSNDAEIRKRYNKICEPLIRKRGCSTTPGLPRLIVFTLVATSSEQLFTKSLRIDGTRYYKKASSQIRGRGCFANHITELKGFYAYGLAAEVFAVCGVGSFLPVALEQLARENGVLWSDNTIPCVSESERKETATILAGLLSRAAGSDTDSDTNHQCVVPDLGNMTTSSFALYTFSIAVFVQALALVSFSVVADHGRYRKKFLIGFGVIEGISSALFIFVVPRMFLVGPILAVVGVTCLGSSFVILNSFLPLLVTNHPQAQDGSEPCTNSSLATARSPNFDESELSVNDDATCNITRGGGDVPDPPALALSTKISSKGVGIGYMAAVFVQILSILTVENLCGVHNLCLGNGMENCEGGRKTETNGALPSRMVFALRCNRDSIRNGNTVRSNRTRNGHRGHALLSITATSSGIAGAFIWPVISRHFKLRTNRTIVACIAFMEIIPLYGLWATSLSYNPWVSGACRKLGRSIPSVSAQCNTLTPVLHSDQIARIGIIHGFVMGGLASYCRSYFGLLIPPGSEAAFYALYAITDKGSSAVGPAVVGAIVDATGHTRPAFFFLAILIALPAPLIMMVDAEKGREDAARSVRIQEVSDDSPVQQADTELRETEGLMVDHD